MSYNEAYSISPLLFIPNIGSELSDVANDYFDAILENVFVDGIEMTLWMRFKHERLYKIVAQYDPEMTEDLVTRFVEALGPGEDKSKSYLTRDGNSVQQTVLFWDYPTAKLFVVKRSDNDQYATN